MVYYTGDIHGSKFEIIRFCHKFQLTREDIIIILGDAGINYYNDERDIKLKKEFTRLKPTILCIHGNHEIRPHNIPSYTIKEWSGGVVWYEEAYPNILFAKDGEIYNIEGINHLVLGGAYSVDKFYRLSRGFGWWADEQPSESIKKYVEEQIKTKEIDVILSHTCPKKYIPTEMFLPMVAQSSVDNSTEEWLNTIEERVNYNAWYCGHWHTDKHIDKIHFLFKTFESIDSLKTTKESVLKNIQGEEQNYGQTQ